MEIYGYKKGKAVMVRKTFSGGIHPFYSKEDTASKPIRKALEPKKVIIPLLQHIGSPAHSLVKVGDPVRIGQKIGESNGFISSPVHSSISGKVLSIQPHPHPLGMDSLSVIVENDGDSLLDEGIKPKGNLSTLTSDEIKQVVREAGIVGMGGAGFPTYVKLSPPSNAKIDSFILNCAECEPYLTCDYRLIIERVDDVIYGMKLLMKGLGVTKGFIGIEDNKPEAITILQKTLGKDREIYIIVLKTKYPQGAERQLIKAILNREIPPGGLPLDIGVVVNNVGTVFATAEAVKNGMPLIKRIVTVAGNGVAIPQNLEVKLGTTVGDIIRQSSGSSPLDRESFLTGHTDDIEKVIVGGPMMGIAQYTLDVPVIKGTSGILVLTSEQVSSEVSHPCIKCGRCVDNCPMHLLPLYLGIYGEKELWERCEKFGALDCIECGCCAYICPAKIPLVQIIKLAKREIAVYKKSIRK